MGLRLVINFAYADATRAVVTDRTVVANLKTSEDVTETRKTAVKYEMPVTQYSEGTSLEGNFGAVRPAVVCFSHLLNRSRSSFSVGDMACIDLSGMDDILKIHCVLGTSRSLFGQVAPTRGRFGPRLLSRGSVDGCEWDAEERFISVMLTVHVSKIWYLGIPLFFPVSTG